MERHEHEHEPELEHEHEHHHHHPEAELEPAEPLQVSSMIQDAAVVISCQYQVTAEKEKVAGLLKSHMEKLASALNEKGAFIGHIKASLTTSTIDTFFLTDTVAERKSTDYEENNVSFAAILFSIEEETAKDLCEEMFQEIDRKVRSEA